MTERNKPLALISVANKRGVADFAARLTAAGYEVLSTGGTLNAIREAGVAATPVSEYTGSPEVFGGRVKTLHPKIHGGILMRRGDVGDAAEAEANGIRPIDIVAVNLYAFRETVARPDVTLAEAIEKIDIGGPTMVRSAAKNSSTVTIVVDPEDYSAVADEVDAGGVGDATRRRLSLKAFRHTAAYDAAIASWLGTNGGDNPTLPEEVHRPLIRVQSLRYGENPHQAAALYRDDGVPELNGAVVLQGKALSYNNLVDLDGAQAAVLEFDEPAAVVVKHTNPCGVGRDSSSLLQAYRAAHAGDPVSAFGGIVALNRPVGADVAAALAETFLEVVTAPGFDDEARQILSAKTNLRLIDTSAAKLDVIRARPTLFGTLIQDDDPRISDIAEDWTVATERAPTSDEATALRFLWRVCKHVKSNAIVVGSSSRTYGVGAGQMSRVDAARLAVTKATGDLAGAALASDAFFPFRDGVDVAAEAGIRAVIQPGGSKRDSEVIAAANEHGIAMVFTGHRHFRH